MRTIAIALLLAACHHDAPVPMAPMLPPPATAPASPPEEDPPLHSTDATKFVAVPTDPAVPVEADLGTAPASAPRGEPIVVTITAPAPGDRRRRTERTIQLHDSRSRGQLSHQKTETTFVFDEELLAAIGLVPTRVRVGVSTAHESLHMDGADRQELELLAGEYTIGRARDNPDQIEVTRGAGLVVHSREEEELDSAFGEYLAGPDKLVQLVAAKRLRLGESAQLTDEERRPFTGDEPTQMWITIVAADAQSVTVQTDGQPNHARGDAIELVRIRTTYARATGRMLARTALRTLRDSWHASALFGEVTFATSS